MAASISTQAELKMAIQEEGTADGEDVTLPILSQEEVEKVVATLDLEDVFTGSKLGLLQPRGF